VIAVPLQHRDYGSGVFSHLDDQSIDFLIGDFDRL
jgi:hypothetical protein